MKFYWQKLGLLYSPDAYPRHPKLYSHAANPVALPLEKQVYRILFSGRDSKNRSSIGAVDVNMNTLEVVSYFYEPLFTHGEEGSFYADGVTLGNFYEVNGVKYLVFMGWQNPPDAHWRGDIGRLVITENWELYLDPKQPLLGRNPIDRVSLSYPWVLYDKSKYHMWYGSTITWDAGDGEMLHVINYAFSDDGHTWYPQGMAVPYRIGTHQAFSRPSVVKVDDTYMMWFSYRGSFGQKYRIGYAYSLDGVNWQLALDKAGITPSKQGWDSEMIEYPYVFKYQDSYFMLYNGNGYGKTGFGIAVLEVLK